MKETNIQEQPIQNLAFSESFKQMAEKQNLKILNDLLQLSPQQILSIPNLNFTHLKEYRAFITDNDLDQVQTK